MAATEPNPRGQRLFAVARHIHEVAGGLGAASILLLAGFTALAAFQRYLLRTSDASADEIERYLLVFSVFVVSGAAYAENQHVRAEILVRALPGRLATVALAAVDLAGIAFCAFLGWQGTVQVLALQEADVRSGSTLAAPLYLVEAILPLSMVLLALAFVEHLIRLLLGADREEPSAGDGQATGGPAGES